MSSKDSASHSRKIGPGQFTSAPRRWFGESVGICKAPAIDKRAVLMSSKASEKHGHRAVTFSLVFHPRWPAANTRRPPAKRSFPGGSTPNCCLRQPSTAPPWAPGVSFTTFTPRAGNWGKSSCHQACLRLADRAACLSSGVFMGPAPVQAARCPSPPDCAPP